MLFFFFFFLDCSFCIHIVIQAILCLWNLCVFFIFWTEHTSYVVPTLSVDVSSTLRPKGMTPDVLLNWTSNRFRLSFHCRSVHLMGRVLMKWLQGFLHISFPEVRSVEFLVAAGSNLEHMDNYNSKGTHRILICRWKYFLLSLLTVGSVFHMDSYQDLKAVILQ